MQYPAPNSSLAWKVLRAEIAHWQWHHYEVIISNTHASALPPLSIKQMTDLSFILIGNCAFKSSRSGQVLFSTSGMISMERQSIFMVAGLSQTSKSSFSSNTNMPRVTVRLDFSCRSCSTVWRRGMIKFSRKHWNKFERNLNMLIQI